MAAPACLTVTLVRLTHTISTNFRIPHKKKWAEVLAASTSTAAPLLLHNQTQMASAIWAAYGCHLIQSVEYVYHLHQAPFDDKVAWLDERQSARSQKKTPPCNPGRAFEIRQKCPALLLLLPSSHPLSAPYMHSKTFKGATTRSLQSNSFPTLWRKFF